MGRGPRSLAVPPSLIYGRAGQPIRFWLDNRQNMRTRSIILFAARYIFIVLATSLFMKASSAISSFASAVRYLIRIYSYLIFMLPVFRRYTQPGYLGPWLGFQPLRPFSPSTPSCSLGFGGRGGNGVARAVGVLHTPRGDEHIIRQNKEARPPGHLCSERTMRDPSSK